MPRTLNSHAAPGSHLEISLALTHPKHAASPGAVRRGLGTAAVIGPLTLAMIAITAHFVFHVSALTILTSSMRPHYDPGSVVITQTRPVLQLRIGDVVVLRPPGQSEQVAHRIVAISGDPHRPVLETKGDANPARDPWRAKTTTRTLPVVIADVPRVGRIAMAVRKPWARALLVLLIGLLGTALLVRRNWPIATDVPPTDDHPTNGRP
jgi:signal peptidase